MSVISLGTGPATVKEDDLKPILSKAGLTLSDALIGDYATLLSGLESAIASLADDRSLLPKPDLSKYPRTDIHIPEDTEGGGWATKVCAAFGLVAAPIWDIEEC